MAFKNAKQRGAFFEKEKQQGLAGKPAGFGQPKPPGTNPASSLNTLPELSKMNKMAGIKPIQPITPVKPLGSFEKLKRSIKMPKVGN